MQGQGLMRLLFRVNHEFLHEPGGLVVEYLGLTDNGGKRRTVETGSIELLSPTTAYILTYGSY
jgi:hypothetical protein